LEPVVGVASPALAFSRFSLLVQLLRLVAALALTLALAR